MNLDGTRIDLFSRKDGLINQSNLGEKSIELKGLNPGDKVAAGDYQVATEDINGNRSPLVDVPAFTVSGSATPASSVGSASLSPASAASSAASSASSASSSASSAGKH